MASMPADTPPRRARKPPPPGLDLTNQSPGPLPVSDTGSLRDGNVSLNMQGLRISSDDSSASGVGQDDKQYIVMQREDMDVLRPLGEGTSGVVQLVRHKPTDQLMALKIIPLGIAERERKQILQELRVLHRALVHGERADASVDSDAGGVASCGGEGGTREQQRVPSIISFFGAFYADGAIHIALEYMECGSLHDALRRRGAIDERVLKGIATQVLRGLHALQQLKIVHRDVKPANVLLNSVGDVKLADLGMCGELANSFSRLRSWVGTAAYMSPERISGADYSFNSDVWSLGISLWECATGRYPFGSADLTFWELLHDIVEGDALGDPLPNTPSLSVFLVQALRRDPSERPDASALLHHEWVRDRTPPPGTLQAWVKEVVGAAPSAGIDLFE